MLRLSVLDQTPVPEGATSREALLETIELAKLTEKLGYHRFWMSEHHNTTGLGHSSPEVLIAAVAAQTNTIRVGSGGVMLPHYSAYKVAENFRLLEALYPGRIDLGLGRAPGGMPIATRALQEGRMGGVDRYPQQVEDLLHYFGTVPKGDHRFGGLIASPAIDSAPEVWLLGSSGDSAGLAADLGLSFSFAQFINGAGGAYAVKAYREHFTPNVSGTGPQAMVSIFAICADTDEEAERLASSFDYQFLLLEQGKLSGGLLPPEKVPTGSFTPIERMRIQENRKRIVIGSPETVKYELLRLADTYGTNEIMVATMVHDFAAKRRSYELLAEAFVLADQA
ncbi:luciferase family oxidoreductase group 1 [Paenibacillus phyllosphaerae]|uniref:Luciferase family oxidoreductase group 1 n=1 Tax=Paenibacillus phyllosphaerae TaxID=274593 RepID=A0A7W5FQ16_9BACL|nr:LLM class flavin-dependent oxidoreductase [Paenibacillus phyllosphaerae]MBB3112574.1 luciferase family oxidoreductase group 1 [Paenibacillus phyllosphaerae]